MWNGQWFTSILIISYFREHGQEITGAYKPCTKDEVHKDTPESKVLGTLWTILGSVF